MCVYICNFLSLVLLSTRTPSTRLSSAYGEGTLTTMPEDDAARATDSDAKPTRGIQAEEDTPKTLGKEQAEVSASDVPAADNDDDQEEEKEEGSSFSRRSHNSHNSHGTSISISTSSGDGGLAKALVVLTSGIAIAAGAAILRRFRRIRRQRSRNRRGSGRSSQGASSSESMLHFGQSSSSESPSLKTNGGGKEAALETLIEYAPLLTKDRLGCFVEEVDFKPPDPPGPPHAPPPLRGLTCAVSENLLDQGKRKYRLASRRAFSPGVRRFRIPVSNDTHVRVYVCMYVRSYHTERGPSSLLLQHVLKQGATVTGFLASPGLGLVGTGSNGNNAAPRAPVADIGSSVERVAGHSAAAAVSSAETYAGAKTAQSDSTAPMVDIALSGELCPLSRPHLG